MTTPKLIMQGSKVKATLEQLQTNNPGRVRIDWLRFTVPVHTLVKWLEKFQGVGEVGDTLPGFFAIHRHHLAVDAQSITDTRPLMPADYCGATVNMDGHKGYLTPAALAYAGHFALREFLDPYNNRRGLFAKSHPITAEASGMDFYAARSAVHFEGATVGYICAGGRSQNQANTVHFNLFGSACLHLDQHDMARIAQFVDDLGGWITRTDLCLDVWSGLDVADVRQAWLDGRFDVRGKRPSQKEHGAWSSGHSRTFEVGNRETGKLLRAYEKGHELFGHQSGDPWVRLEVEFRNNHRVLESDILRRPADFFAGAYGYLADYLASLNAHAQPCRIPTQSETKDATAQAAVTRVIRWLTNTAGPSLAAVFNMGGDLVADIVEASQHKTTRRLRGFARETVQACFQVATVRPTVTPIAIGA